MRFPTPGIRSGLISIGIISMASFTSLSGSLRRIEPVGQDTIAK